MGLVMVEISSGLGRHRYYLPSSGYERFLKYDYLDWLQVFVTLALSKISICLFLLRLSNFNRLRTFLWALIAFLVFSHLPLFLLILLQCRPVSGVWNPAVDGKCFSKVTIEKIIIVQGSMSNGLPAFLSLLMSMANSKHSSQSMLIMGVDSLLNCYRLRWGRLSYCTPVERED